MGIISAQPRTLAHTFLPSEEESLVFCSTQHFPQVLLHVRALWSLQNDHSFKLMPLWGGVSCTVHLLSFLHSPLFPPSKPYLHSKYPLNDLLRFTLISTGRALCPPHQLFHVLFKASLCLHTHTHTHICEHMHTHIHAHTYTHMLTWCLHPCKPTKQFSYLTLYFRAILQPRFSP